MGLRINKLIGYGISDLISDEDGEPIDPRLCWKSLLSLNLYDLELQDYFDWCRNNKNDLKLLAAKEFMYDITFDSYYDMMMLRLKNCLKNNKDQTLRNCIHGGGEFHLSNILVFIPPGMNDWHRYDNIIDYVEEVGTQRFSILPGTGIHPYDGTGIRRVRKPKEVVAHKIQTIYGDKIKQFCYPLDKEKQPIDLERFSFESYNMFCQGYFFQNEDDLMQHFKEDWRPFVPLEILSLIKFLNCFPDAFGENGICNNLKPMLYTYWD